MTMATRRAEALAPVGQLTLYEGNKVELVAWWNVKNQGTVIIRTGVRLILRYVQTVLLVETSHRLDAIGPYPESPRLGPETLLVGTPSDPLVGWAALPAQVAGGQSGIGSPFYQGGTAPGVECHLDARILSELTNFSLTPFKRFDVVVELYQGNAIVATHTIQDPFGVNYQGAALAGQGLPGLDIRVV